MWSLLAAGFVLQACGDTSSGVDEASGRDVRGGRPGDRPGAGGGGGGEDDEDPLDAGGSDDEGSGTGGGESPDGGAVDPDGGTLDDTGGGGGTPEDTGVPEGDIVAPPDVNPDALADGGGIYDPDGGPISPDLCPAESIVPPQCILSSIEGNDGLCDGFDNDCDGMIDEECPCKLGDVQPCFEGPPGRVNTGACESGTQRCGTTSEGTLRWGACEGGIGPRTEVCDGLDNDCNGCLDELPGCDGDATCPGPGDPRTPDAQPFVDYALRGADFYPGPATAWSWTIVGGPCDDIVPGRRSFELIGPNSQNATFRPSLSGSYTVTLRVTTPDGIFECTWIIHVVGPGVRIEMCYPESTTQDVDLLMMRTTTPGNWYGSGDVYRPNADACSWWNCEASLRGASSRANWGYANTDISNCEGGPQGDQWRRLGYCANPRLDIDNNLSEGIGVPENINVDNPRMGDSYRIMLHNFSGTVARPLVNIYCGGRLKATFGAAPDQIVGFEGRRAQVGAMWRVADVVAIVDEFGTTIDCTVTAIHPPGATSGYDLTIDNSRY